MNIMKCDNCNELLHDSNSNNNIINSKNFAVKLNNGKIVCTACSDSISFINDLSDTKIRDIPKKQTIIIKTESKIMCINCNEIYSGNKCPKCQTINPLTIRKKKKKKKKKEKKEKKEK
jgi:hypothetical protein